MTGGPAGTRDPAVAAAAGAGRGTHVLAVIVAGWTFALLFVGGLVTSREAGMVFPDWPLSYGTFNPPRWWAIAEQREEHGHRLLGWGLGILVVGLAAWIHRADPRPWMRRFGWTLVGLVALQGLLGGFRVLADLPAAAFVHGIVGQGIFCVAVAAALFTSPGWREDPPPAPVEGARRLHRRALFAVIAVYLQVALGALVRHSRAGHSIAHVLPHLAFAAVAAGFGLAAAGEALGRHADRPRLEKPALLLGAGLLLQTILGALAYFANVRGAEAVDRPPAQFWTATAHQATGAVVLASAVVLFLRSRRGLAEPGAATEGAAAAEGSPIRAGGAA